MLTLVLTNYSSNEVNVFQNIAAMSGGDNRILIKYGTAAKRIAVILELDNPGPRFAHCNLAADNALIVVAHEIWRDAITLDENLLDVLVFVFFSVSRGTLEFPHLFVS